MILLQECVLAENHVSFEIKILFHFEDIHGLTIICCVLGTDVFVDP